MSDITHIAVDDIMTRPDVAELFGVSAQAVSKWARTGQSDFPGPVVTTRQGQLYSRRQVEAWGKKTGRLT